VPARLLGILGSGETTPTMVKTHRGLLGRLGPPPVPAVVLNTPFGFQENADELAARAVEYFKASLDQVLEVAEFRSAAVATADPVGYESMLAGLRRARYVFAGPGSPSYALRQWAGSPLPDVFRDKLRDGGCIAFASAAALTPLAGRARPAGRVGSQCGGDPALQQRRGRDPRHAVLLSG
jgi:hypothetical protein